MNAAALPAYHYGILKGYLAGQNAPAEILVAAEALYSGSIQGPPNTELLEAIRHMTEAAEGLLARAQFSPPLGSEPLTLLEVVSEEKPCEIKPPVATTSAPVVDTEDEVAIPPLAPQESDEAKIEAFLKAKPIVAVSSDSKKRREWSPEARAAAGERMRVRQSAGMMKRPGAEVRERKTIKDDFKPVIIKRGKPIIEESEASPVNSERLPEELGSCAIATAPISSPADRWQPTLLSSGDWPDIHELLASGTSRERIAGDYDVPLVVLDEFIDQNLAEAKERRAAKDAGSGEA